MSNLPRLENTADNTSMAAYRAEEDRLCAIIDSERTPLEEKYKALIDLAALTGTLNGLAEAA